jgi:hypothetical protein
MAGHWVCLDCGERQTDEGACRACTHDTTLDLREPTVRLLMRDVERRLAERRQGRFRTIGAISGMAVVFGMWTLPGYWEARSMTFALPVLLDQWLYMAVIGLGIAWLLKRIFDKPRFPYLHPTSASGDSRTRHASRVTRHRNMLAGCGCTDAMISLDELDPSS